MLAVEKPNWIGRIPTLFIVLLVAVSAVTYYWVVWHDVPGLVAALDHCKELFCDFTRQYHPTGQRLLDGAPPSNGYFYSSFFALLLTPLGRLSVEAALPYWGAFQLASVILLLLPAVDFYQESKQAGILYIVLVVFAMPLLHNLKWGQVSALLTGCVFAALFLYRRGHPLAAAVILALATAIKYYVGIFALYFLLRRDWRFLAVYAATTLLFWLVIPTLVLGWQTNWQFYLTVRERAAHALATWLPEDINAQYLPSVVSRWLGSQSAWPLLRLLGYVVFVLNGLVAIRVARSDRPRRAEWAFALLFLSLPFVIPTSWPHYFVYLPFAQTLAWLEVRHLSGFQRVLPSGLLLTSIALASMPLFQLVGRWQDYSQFGFLFVANSLVFVLALVLTLQPATGESDRPPLLAEPAAETP